MQINRLFRLERRFQSSLDVIRQQLLWTLLLRVVLYTLLLGVSFLLHDDKYEVITIPPNLLVLCLLVIYLSTIGSAFVLLRSPGDLRRFGFIQCLLDVVFASVLIYLSGCSESIFTSIYFFPIIAGGLLIPIKGGLIGAAASTLLYGVILGLEYLYILPDYLAYYGVFQDRSLLVSINHFAVRGLTFFLAAIISAIFGARLKTTTEALSSTRTDFDRLARLYKEIFDNIGTGIITVDAAGIITSANNAIAAITGLELEEMNGRNLAALFPGIDLGSTSPRNVCDFQRRDGQSIRLGYAHTSLHRPRRRNEDESGDGKPAPDEVTIITLKDISEIERLENQMRQAEKLAAIGMMSASIAHDFRNPLTAISGSAQLLASEFSTKGGSDLQNYELTKIILRESDRLISTIGDFLRFARPDSVDREWLLLLPCIKDVLQVCTSQSNWPASCEIKLEIPPMFKVWADEKQLFTVISHLIHNAVAFCPPGWERLQITAAERTGPDQSNMHCLTVNDNGPGLPEPEQLKIFEPFYTTRPDGTGLGLAIVKQIVEAHGGYIVVGRAAELGGASFSIYLAAEANA